MRHSVIQQRGPVPFPEFIGERVRMAEFRPAAGLPSGLARWQPTVDAMLQGVDAPGPVYILIDQRVVKPGTTHRRPGLHVDGYWNPVAFEHNPGPKHGPFPRRIGSWADAELTDPEAILLAADVEASYALAGPWDGPIGEGGDCSRVDVSRTELVPIRAGWCYAGNAAMLHNAVPLERRTCRTVVRLNVPGWSV